MKQLSLLFCDSLVNNVTDCDILLVDKLGHMRTNKNCPKYGETETNVETPEPEKVPGKSTSLNPSGLSQTKTVTKKLIPKSATKIALVEASEGENTSPGTKVLPLKFKCGSTEKIPDKSSIGATQSTDQPVMSDTDTGKSTVKINKIIISNKSKPEDLQIESHKPPIVIRPPSDTDRGQAELQKPTIVIRPPANTERDRIESSKILKRPRTEKDREQSHKKIVIKRPKEIIDVDQVAQDGGTSTDHRKTKRIVELSSFEMQRNQENVYLAEAAAKKKARDNRKLWEEQERRRNEERLREERARRLREEEIRMLEEQERVAEIRRYEVAIRREREEEERQKAKKKKKKKRPAIEDDYMEDSRTRRFDKRMPERDRSAKRRPVVESGGYGADYATTTKRRRGGEVIYLACLIQCSFSFSCVHF